jgi:hypothetical protein
MSASSLPQSKTPLLSNGLYNTLKNSATLVLPAAGALYFALSKIWGLPNGEEVTGSIAALNVFLGVLLGVSTTSYNNSDAKFTGTLNVAEVPGQTLPALSTELNVHPVALKDQSAALFKVNQIPAPPTV